MEHRTFADLPEYLRQGDLLIRNNAAVLPARLRAQRPTGGATECFLLRPTETDNVWWCLLKPGKKLPVGAVFSRAGGFVATVLEKDAGGCARVSFATERAESIVAVANRLGEVPLPPYIARDGARAAARATDLDRYQTVYADRDRQVAVAAPTAGLHFTPELLETVRSAGVETVDITLHVGLGTFKPIASAFVENHSIHREIYELSAPTQRALFASRAGRKLAVGTTSVRTLEDFLSTHSEPLSPERTYTGEASIFIYPPRHFRGVDALITNFHQPRSTLLCLVAAFLCPGSLEGIEWLQEIYRTATTREYRFLSYGDAMLIL